MQASTAPVAVESTFSASVMNSRLNAWQLQSHTALITGASKGIGYAVARELAAKGGGGR
jgi:hypothetical protein